MRPDVRACTEFRFAQDSAAFPPRVRFLIARLAYLCKSWTGTIGLLRLRGITLLPRPRTVHAAFTAHGSKLCF